MKREASDRLDHWINQPDLKPLVLRGARQTGKTWIVRDLAARHNRRLVEVNFERNPEFSVHFENNDPEKILRNLSAELAVPILPENTLLFLDEIQAAPQILATLRWFKEELPALPVIAAGSLLDFILYYWQRTGGRQGEIDYLVQSGNRIVPVEVKSGSEGAMKSLHQFMFEKQLKAAVRLDINNFSRSNLSVKTTQGNPVQYTLFSIPIYLAERVFELLD